MIRIGLVGIAILLIGMAHCYPQFDNGNPWLRPQQPNQLSLLPDGGGSTTTTTPRPTTQPPRFYACLQSCPATSEYNPICGSDSVNYYNENKFNCALNCGLNIQQLHRGIC
ncbi:uncharacterized protein LOC108029960 isoform X1 [Drosophila biarmipes]|uniref:uncharacterized protein LOC108029960 isoform X1 n=1 Tax=Drosophila biarmipes TaxID=125945 RepID=UPI0007E8B31A|nr:uncharacterized protein LOC108029960 isoform X1 [Drosophila biarmipes]